MLFISFGWIEYYFYVGGNLLWFGWFGVVDVVGFLVIFLWNVWRDYVGRFVLVEFFVF